MSIIRALFFTLVLLSVSTPAIAEEDYFTPVVKAEREALETMVNEIGIQLSDVRIYKTVSEIKTIEHKLASKVLYRKKINDGYNWVVSKKGQQHVNLNLGLPKSPNIAINEQGHIIAINIKKPEVPFENTYHLKHFKELVSLAVMFLDDCNNNTVKNLPELKKLKDLFLNCRNNIRFPNLALLPNMTYLHILSADLKHLKIPKDNSLRSLTITVEDNAKYLSEFIKLQHLEKLDITVVPAQNNQIENLSWLSSIRNLNDLFISGITNATSFSSLGQLTNLKSLHIDLNSIKKLPGLSNLEDLETLRLQMYHLISLPSLTHMTKLKSLRIEETRLSNLDFLKGNNSLQSFVLSQAPVVSMRPVEDLTNLEELKIFTTKISKIEGLEKMKSLKSLEIIESPISRIEGLDKLESLEKLNLTRMKIDKIENLENLENLKNLKEFVMPRFKKNQENYEYLKALEKRGVLLI